MRRERCTIVRLRRLLPEPLRLHDRRLIASWASSHLALEPGEEETELGEDEWLDLEMGQLPRHVDELGKHYYLDSEHQYGD
jgi:hypothetical protein